MIKTTIDVKNLIDQDPNGLSPHTPGAKLDANKPNCDLVFGGFSNALLEVAKVGTFGAQKYTDNGWKSVPNGVNRYRSAAYRHLLSNDFLDNDSNLPHLAHAAWNCLAAFELSLSKIGVKVNNEDVCGLCGKPGANKHKHPYHWPGEVNPEGEFVHDECEQYERDRAFIEFRGKGRRKRSSRFLEKCLDIYLSHYKQGSCMSQTRLGSLIESLMNIVIGYGIALLSQLAIFPMFDIHISLATNLWIGVWFTLISLIRSYVIRRWFNARLHNAAQTIANNL